MNNVAVEVGKPWPLDFPRHDTIKMNWGTTSTGRLFPQVVMHVGDSVAEVEADFRGELVLFAIFRHPSLFPAGLPIFGFQPESGQEASFYRVPLVIGGEPLRRWSRQCDVLVGYSKQEGAITHFKEFDDAASIGEISITVHDWRSDKVVVMRRIFLPVDVLCVLRECWMRDINAHTQSVRQFAEVDQIPINTMIDNSRTWVFRGNAHKEVTLV